MLSRKFCTFGPGVWGGVSEDPELREASVKLIMKAKVTNPTKPVRLQTALTRET
jgi:hypothetical protein